MYEEVHYIPLYYVRREENFASITLEQKIEWYNSLQEHVAWDCRRPSFIDTTQDNDNNSSDDEEDIDSDDDSDDDEDPGDEDSQEDEEQRPEKDEEKQDERGDKGV
jgi:hypothetical protein